MDVHARSQLSPTQVPTSCSLSSLPSFGDLSTTQSSGTIPVLLFDVTEDQYVYDGNNAQCSNETVIIANFHMTPSDSYSGVGTCGTFGHLSEPIVEPCNASSDRFCLQVANAADSSIVDGDGSNGALSTSVLPDIMILPALMPTKEDTLETLPRGGYDHVSVQFNCASSSIRKLDAGALTECALIDKDLLSGKSWKHCHPAPPSTAPIIPIPTSLSVSTPTQSCSPLIGPTQPVRKYRHTMSLTPPPMNLPDHLCWLQNTSVDLWIDQEGFRAVCPTFKLVGYTKPELGSQPIRAGMHRVLGNIGGVDKFTELMNHTSADPDCGYNLDVGMAEFMPIKREGFVFHHAKFDTPPMLRKLCINGDDSRDFLSQRAHLHLKSSDGVQVYTVHGSESKRTRHRDEDDRSDDFVRLEWQFEYAVEDKRKPDGARVGNGEKVLTPLWFSCSPGLVHPGQGRKVTVMQVWKKNVQPRVVAGKMGLPKPPIAPDSGLPSLSSISELPPKAIRGNFKFAGGYKMAIWNINGNRRPKSSYGLLKEYDEEDADGRRSRAYKVRGRRNSTSSIGDGYSSHSARSSVASVRSRSLDARFLDIDQGMAQFVQRQILSTEELERLSTDDKPSSRERRLTCRDEEWNIAEQEGYGALSPPPFHRRARR